MAGPGRTCACAGFEFVRYKAGESLALDCAVPRSDGVRLGSWGLGSISVFWFGVGGCACDVVLVG